MTEFDDERSLREIDDAYYSRLAEFDHDRKIMSEIDFIETWLSTFIKVRDCSCCHFHEFKLKERLKRLKNGN